MASVSSRPILMEEDDFFAAQLAEAEESEPESSLPPSSLPSARQPIGMGWKEDPVMKAMEEMAVKRADMRADVREGKKRMISEPLEEEDPFGED